jgi:hypothetical protein
MRERDSTNPVTFFFLVLQYGISNGFVSITLPFILTRAGFSVLRMINDRQSRASDVLLP